MNKKQIGDIGEDLCCRFLINNGFEIIERNYKRNCGEIDIIGFRKGTIHFFEVKTVSRETFNLKYIDEYRPEDNVSHAKNNKIEKVTRLFLLERGFVDDFIQIDLLTVFIKKEKLINGEVNALNEDYIIKYLPNINFD